MQGKINPNPQIFQGKGHFLQKLAPIQMIEHWGFGQNYRLPICPILAKISAFNEVLDQCVSPKKHSKTMEMTSS